MFCRDFITRPLENRPVSRHQASRSNNAGEDFSYLFSKDQALINQFVALRKHLSRFDNRLKGFRHFSHYEQEDYSSPDKHILLIIKKSRCVGGACLNVSTPNHRVPLPIDDEFASEKNQGFFLLNTFPDLRLERESYCEISRVILHPKLRDGKHIRRMFSHFIELTRIQSCKYIFGMGDAVRLRNNRNIFLRAFGMESEIFFDLELPQKDDFEGKKMYLMVVYTQNSRDSTSRAL